MGLFDKLRHALTAAKPTPGPDRPATVDLPSADHDAAPAPYVTRAPRTPARTPTPATTPSSSAAPSASPQSRRRNSKVQVEHLRVIDLTGLESTRTRIKGSAYVISDAARVRAGGPNYLLIREPQNKQDPLAVGIYGMNGSQVGYVSAARAASMSRLLEQLDADAFLVGGAGASKGSVVLWVDLPKADPLRRFVRAQTS